ncbi:diflavin oxidoreductase [Rubellicoccus peritrichatus]|uniref:assimilatory sulfite reductase (NADPH) n=1 Tax=Rubellicoccus peritrichatus TaxID=3080537 RepID=A0AAQ3QV75_9BACT|nr:flavodoxin domain-containing protein [Puniceicoccus sp. CR14]WOO40620.1 flavodoxin domain-containing protein [Puniceicoccus sp. CR14]
MNLFTPDSFKVPYEISMIGPEKAPFTDEQIVWLNNHLAKQFGLFAKQLASFELPLDEGPAVPVTILWGSQTGNAEGLANQMAAALAEGRFEPSVIEVVDYEVANLASEKNLLVVTSTYGDGEPPDNAVDFVDALCAESAPRVEGLQFSVLALGDSQYPDFCQAGKIVDQRLAELGGERIHERVDCDVDFDQPFELWKKGVLDVLGTGATTSKAQVTSVNGETFGKNKPFPASILKNYDLNREGAFKSTHHVELSLRGSGLEYEAGDALGVYPVNDEKVVDEILAVLSLDSEAEVPLPDGGNAPLREALLKSYDIRTLSKKLVTDWQKRSSSEVLKSIIEEDKKEVWEKFFWGRELVDLVIDYPVKFQNGEEFVAILKKLHPRLYSIASSPKAHPDEVHLTVGVVTYETHGRSRGGVCSTYLANRSEDSQPGVFVQTNKAFRPPADDDAPMIMVGPGTGIAPFRAFLEEREVRGAKGKNWLLFGNPYRATDYLYDELLEGWKESGLLNKLDLAFSRDQEEKLYVQHLMLESGAEIWQWLQEGGYFFVCGDALRMAKDVDKALHEVVQVHGVKSEDEAQDYIRNLRKEKRYARDVY